MSAFRVVAQYSTLSVFKQGACCLSRKPNLSSIQSRQFCVSRKNNAFKVLGIETSCDDTGVAIVDSERNLLGDALYNQMHIHLE